MIFPNINTHGKKVALNMVNEFTLPQWSCKMAIFIKYMNIITINKNKIFPYTGNSILDLTNIKIKDNQKNVPIAFVILAIV
jgi:hypothetical protein